jgi:TatD DNase family protein
MDLTDTHCHIHEAVDHFVLRTETKKKYEKAGSPQPDDIVRDAVAAGVNRMICVGCSVEDSEVAVDFTQTRPHVWASIGIHPHEAKIYRGKQAMLERFGALASRPKVVAVGECGLDFYYNNSEPGDQEAILRFQIELALAHDLPMIFHVRDAFEQFWPIFDSYQGIRGVIHSFSSNRQDLEQVLSRGLHVGLNGIMTFTKDPEQLAAAKAVPSGQLLLETDAPFLTPAPYRGTICQPKHVRTTAEFLADLRGESPEDIAARTSANAVRLFGLKSE